jgi:hypothetical protein
MKLSFSAKNLNVSLFTLWASLLAINLYAASNALAGNVTWEVQAERLQNVSAALLDNLPNGAPVSAQFSLGIGTQVSFLPKPSPRVGGKEEKVPSSPLHAVPTISLNALPFLNSGNWGRFIGTQIWAGYLPPGGEKLFGVKAKLNQYSFGAALLAAIPITSTLYFYSPLGYQYNYVDIEGAITEENASDSFKANTNLFYLAPGLRYVPWKVWGNVMLGQKTTRSTFVIPADSTKFEITDDLSDTNLPFFTQLTVGYDLPYNLSANLSYEYMAERLAMPKVGIAYQYSFL